MLDSLSRVHNELVGSYQSFMKSNANKTECNQTAKFQGKLDEKASTLDSQPNVEEVWIPI